MISGQKSQGFTIIETMIFLAVSAAILVSALGLLSGSQNKTQFSEAMKDVNQQMTAIISNVANGYYPRIDNIDCDSTNNPVEITSPGTQARGTSADCIFIGRVASFQEEEDYFTVYTVAGARQINGTPKKEVGSLSEAKPNIVPGPEQLKLKNGITIKRIRINKPSGDDFGAVGFFTSFGVTDAENQLQSGSLVTDFASLPDTTITDVGDGDVASQIRGGGSFLSDYDSSLRNPLQGIELCFASGTTDQVGLLIIGGSGKTATIEQRINEGTDCPTP